VGTLIQTWALSGILEMLKKAGTAQLWAKLHSYKVLLASSEILCFFHSSIEAIPGMKKALSFKLLPDLNKINNLTSTLYRIFNP
jgi:hypothetical protein